MSEPIVPEGYRLRKGQVYTWQEVMDWANEHYMEWVYRQWGMLEKRTPGIETRFFLDCAGDIATAFLRTGGRYDTGDWTCTYVAPEIALPPLHYYSIMFYCEGENKDAIFLTRATDHMEAEDKAKEEVKKWPGYRVWSVNHINSRPIEAGEVVHLGGG